MSGLLRSNGWRTYDSNHSLQPFIYPTCTSITQGHHHRPTFSNALYYHRSAVPPFFWPRATSLLWLPRFPSHLVRFSVSSTCICDPHSGHFPPCSPAWLPEEVSAPPNAPPTPDTNGEDPEAEESAPGGTVARPPSLTYLRPCRRPTHEKKDKRLTRQPSIF